MEEIRTGSTEGRLERRLQVELLRLHADAADVGVAPETEWSQHVFEQRKLDFSTTVIK